MAFLPNCSLNLFGMAFLQKCSLNIAACSVYSKWRTESWLTRLCFWVLGAAVGKFRVPALWSLFVLMSGLALGRISSLMLDGWPHPLLVVYTVLELVVASVALWFLGTGSKRPDTE
jgi:hypothetical protein